MSGLTRDDIMGAFIEGNYRYKLWRVWDTELPRIAWIMLNPSTADGCKDDATIRRCASFSRSWRFGGMEIYNLFAYRSPYPDDLLAVADPIGTNDRWLTSISPSIPIVAAWGAFSWKLGNRDKKVLDLLGQRRLDCLGMTAKGYPRHPVRLAGSTRREVYWENGGIPGHQEGHA